MRNSLARFDKVFQKIEKFPIDIFIEVFNEAWNTYEFMVRREFDEEGYTNRWKELAVRTQDEREDLDYNPEHPILEREGFLKQALTDQGMGKQMVWVRITQDVTEYFQGGNELVMDYSGPYSVYATFEVLDPRFTELQKYRNMVPEESSTWEQLMPDLESRLIPIADKVADPDA